MALVAYFEFDLHQMDVKMTFLNGNLEEEVCMKQPEGFSSSEGDHLVCKLNKSIYGLKQASRQWYLKFHEVILHSVLKIISWINIYTRRSVGVRFVFLCYM